jgi:uncharacterized membrane protein YdbT with pleckstrin-like domain
MGFPPDLLNEGEEIILDLRPHPWFLAKEIVAVVAALALVVVLYAKVDNDIARYVGLGLLAVAALWLLVEVIQWRTTELVVTGDRLIYRTGILAKSGREIPLERINDITFSQSIFERIIGAGDLLIESGGERGQQTFTDILKPQRVQNEIYRQIEANQNRIADRMAGRREVSIPEQIDQLDDLRRRGVITDVEFETKKADLLGRL